MIFDDRLCTIAVMHIPVQNGNTISFLGCSRRSGSSHRIKKTSKPHPAIYGAWEDEPAQKLVLLLAPQQLHPPSTHR